MVVIESSGITDVGIKRANNEDALFLDDKMKLYLVADGMGGHQAGEIASHLVVETIIDYMNNYCDRKSDFINHDKTLSSEANRLLSGIILSNRKVYEASQSNENYRGMGSTISALYVSDDTLITANVGDSPIYLIHNGSINLLSIPHTMVAEQASLFPKGSAKLGDEYKHILTRAIGIEKNVNADICEMHYYQGDTIVIASDGLSDKVQPDEIMDIVTNEEPDKACASLVNMANDRGGDDNITSIVVKVKKVLNKKQRIKGLLSKLANTFIKKD
ncbi:MAG: serine/threonine-protein phosphatase [Deltaproteobacteria bacterium]|nr:serine/threonine-protein phosphatase [Deltaproteobacteria bacterium]MBW1846968.1 serine/threonine-protein phosphatase [Deltaproteobacteria bacterium]MBW1983768.1 serine/threonine-protein phosphatase [Deltaproteobacteria bacterium]MBW2180390.1 serine/threonine-protein phosphatase [Deltaproteobacteria bacterium]MBW2364087.1 serine/threonine-protein phosphatase [Deltaproteobacteria bacterium]